MASGKVGINLTRYFFYAGNSITAERKKALVALAYATSRTLQFAPKAILIRFVVASVPGSVELVN